MDMPCISGMKSPSNQSNPGLIHYIGPIWIHELELDWVRLGSSNPKVSKQGDWVRCI